MRANHPTKSTPITFSQLCCHLSTVFWLAEWNYVLFCYRDHLQYIASIYKGSTINDLGGGAEENSKMNLFFPRDSLSKFPPPCGRPFYNFFSSERPFQFFCWRRPFQDFFLEEALLNSFFLEKGLQTFFLDFLQPPPQIINGRLLRVIL